MSEKGSFEGWDIRVFLKGRKKLIIAIVGSVVGWIVTNNPQFAVMAGAGAELLYAVIEYYTKEY